MSIIKVKSARPKPLRGEHINNVPSHIDVVICGDSIAIRDDCPQIKPGSWFFISPSGRGWEIAKAAHMGEMRRGRIISIEVEEIDENA